MQNSWVGLALPFGMIGYWFIAALLDLIRTPNTPHSRTSQLNRGADTADVYKPASR